MKTLPLTEAAMLGPFVHYLEAQGGTVARLLDDLNVSREMVDREQGKVTKLQFYRFLNASGARTGQAALGYQIGEHFGMGFVGPVGASVLRAATLKDAIDTFAVHLERWLDGNKLWLETDGDEAWLCNAAHDGLQEHQEISDQCALMTLVSLVREAAGPEWSPEALRLPLHASRIHDEIPGLSGASVITSELGVAVRFPAKFLSYPVGELSKEPPGSQLPTSSPSGFAASMEQTLSDQFPFIGIPSIPQAAELVGTSIRSLQRHLKADGLTYQRMIERIRFRKARERLQQDPHLTIRELSQDLHYATPSGFIRAFHRIAGMTPGKFIQQKRAQP